MEKEGQHHQRGSGRSEAAEQVRGGEERGERQRGDRRRSARHVQEELQQAIKREVKSIQATSHSEFDEAQESREERTAGADMRCERYREQNIDN